MEIAARQEFYRGGCHIPVYPPYFFSQHKLHDTRTFGPPKINTHNFRSPAKSYLVSSPISGHPVRSWPSALPAGAPGDHRRQDCRGRQHPGQQEQQQQDHYGRRRGGHRESARQVGKESDLNIIVRPIVLDFLCTLQRGGGGIITGCHHLELRRSISLMTARFFPVVSFRRHCLLPPLSSVQKSYFPLHLGRREILVKG